jgi:LPS export ABC transporter protein LptC
MPHKTFTWSLLLAAIAGVSYLLARQAGSPTAPAAVAIDQYVIDQANLSQANESGQFVLTLTAQHMRQAHGSPLLQLVAPNIRYQHADTLWFAAARTGQYDLPHANLALMSDVVLTHSVNPPETGAIPARPAAGGAPQLRTQQLMIDINKQRAHSDGAVSLVGSAGQLEWQGLDADLVHQHFRMESQLHGTFTH